MNSLDNYNIELYKFIKQKIVKFFSIRYEINQLFYNKVKDEFNITYYLGEKFKSITQLNKIKTIRFNPFNQIIKILEDYEKIREDEEKEWDSLNILGNNILDLQKIRFKFIKPSNFKNPLFSIHITGEIPYINKFLIRRLEGGKQKEPDEVYFSMGYSISQREGNDLTVLKDIFEYIKIKK